MNNDEKIKRLYEILEEMGVYRRAIGKMSFDMQVCAPRDGMAQAGKDCASLGKNIFALSHSTEYQNLVCELNADREGLTFLQNKLVDRLYERYEKEKNVSADLSYQFQLVQGDAYGKWLTAKEKSDFSVFKGSLEQLISYTRKVLDTREKRTGSYYDACLDDFEKGASEEFLNDFFGRLKKRIIPLIQKIQKEGKPIRDDFMTRPCPIPEQEACSKFLLEKECLKDSALVLMTTEHPFTTNFGRDDVRVTTHYYEENFISNIFTTLHEGGHALFMQNEPAEFFENHTDNGMTMAMHECISRFYENIIGRSPAFIHYIYKHLKDFSGDKFADITERELYEAVNMSKPDLIRCDADELTYPLHIIIRYEIERDFINGAITVDEIPAIWNRKYKEYLGVDVPDDARGCLQDVHWTSDYGYFPSYALGSAYGAQIIHTMQKEFDVFADVEKGDLSRVKQWLVDRVFRIASVTTPKEWIEQITGEPFNPDYFLNYLEKKYTELYRL